MKRQIMLPAFVLSAMLLFTACSLTDSITSKKGINRSTKANTTNETELSGVDGVSDLGSETNSDEADAAKDGRIYMIIKNDSLNYQITLMDLVTADQICYEYTEGTEFFDKYGEYALSDKFSEGKLAAVTRLNSNDTLGAITFTDETWGYEDARKYYIDKEKNRISIVDTVYQCDENMKVFSEGGETDLYAIGENDVLNIYGIGRTIYSVVVKSGHGTLELTNTDLFEGGWMNLGTQVYTKVTKDMSMEIPEGIYQFSVANDGYGDTGEIRIRRDVVTTIDLNDYKGEGPKMCQLSFDVSVDNAVLRIDGKKIDYSKPLEVRYGVHTLGVHAKGYDAWNRQLVINSPTANIDILLTEDNDTSNDNGSDSSGTQTDNSNSENSGSSNKEGSRAGSLAGSMAGSLSGTDSGTSSDSAVSGNKSSSSLANSALSSSLASIITGGDSTDFLDTLADLVKSLDKLNSASSNNGD